MSDLFTTIKQSIKENFNANLTVNKRTLNLGIRSDVTGWRDKYYTEADIEMVIFTSTASVLPQFPGSYVRYDGLGFTDDVVAVGDQIVDADSITYEVKAVSPVKVGATTYVNKVDLVQLPLYIEVVTGGETAWVKVLEPTGESNCRTLFHIASNNALVGTEETAEIWKTTDAGTSWTRKADLDASADDIRAFCQTAVADKIVASSTANPATNPVSIYKSVDAGENWVIADTINPGGFQPGRVFGIIKLDNDDLLAGVRDGQIWKSVDDGDNWAFLAQLADGDFVEDLLNLGGTDVLCCTGKYKQGDAATNKPAVWKSVNSGANWTKKLDASAEEIDLMFLFQSSTSRVFTAGYDSGGMWKSDDDGDNWTKLYDFGDDRMVTRMTAITVDAAEILLVTVGSTATGVSYLSVWKSEDDGDTWTEWAVLDGDTGTKEGTMWIIETNSTYHILLVSSGNHSAQGRVWKGYYA